MIRGLTFERDGDTHTAVTFEAAAIGINAMRGVCSCGWQTDGSYTGEGAEIQAGRDVLGHAGILLQASLDQLFPDGVPSSEIEPELGPPSCRLCSCGSYCAPGPGAICACHHSYSSHIPRVLLLRPSVMEALLQRINRQTERTKMLVDWLIAREDQARIEGGPSWSMELRELKHRMFEDE